MISTHPRLSPLCSMSRRALLGSAEQQIYDAVALAMARGEEGVRTCFLGLPTVNYSEILDAVSQDHPLLYYVNICRCSHRHSALWQEIEWKLHIPAKEIADFDAQLHAALAQHKVKPTGKTLIDEVRIHDHLQDMRIGVPPDKEHEIWEYHNIVGPLLRRQSVCEGIAKLFQLLCQQANVPCRIVEGFAASGKGEGRHAWNQVQINGRLAHVDATWDCNLQLPTHGHCYDYFNLGDTQMTIDHRWDVASFPGECIEKYSYFLMAHQFISSYDELTALVRDRLENGKNAVTVRMRGNWDKKIMEKAIDSALKPWGGSFEYRTNERQRIIDVRVIR